VVADEIDGMAVIINLESGAYYSGTESSAEAWAALVAGAGATELAEAMALPAASLTTFIAHLIDEGLLRSRHSPVQPWSAGPVRGALALAPATSKTSCCSTRCTMSPTGLAAPRG
jgi:hypothetical protein